MHGGLPVLTPALEVTDLKVSVRPRGPAVLDGIGFAVAAGEVFGVTGANGAGKSTLLRSVLDLLDLRQGRIRVAGLPHHLAVANGQVSYLPERFVPPGRLTGLEFLELVDRLRGLTRPTSALVQHAEGFLLPAPMLNQRCDTFSKGTAQKLGLAAAFLGECPLVVLDEPMSGLDPVARVRIRDWLWAAQARNTAVIFSSHMMSDVEKICTRMIMLKEGRSMFVGAPEAFCAEAGTSDLEAAFARCVAADC